MEPTSFFDIQIDDPEQEHGPGVDTPASSGGLGKAGVASAGYSVRLGWMQGVPYLIDLGSAAKVLVNTTPIDPYLPVIIQPGDTITIGNTHLTWHPGTKAGQPDQAGQADRPGRGPEETALPKVTVVLPRVDAEEPDPTSLAEPPSPPGESDEPAPAEAVDSTRPAPKQGAGQSAAEPPDPTLLVPKTAAGPPAPETPDPTLLVPKRAAELPALEIPDDPTLLVPGATAPPPMPEPPDPTLLVPKGAAKPPTPGIPGGEVATPEEALDLPDGTGTYGTAFVDMAQLLEEDAGLEFVSTTIIRDTATPHLVFHMPDKTWEVQLAAESTTIGRGRDNDVAIADESVSAHHALIERRGEEFLIRDVRSRNGIWLGKQRVEEHRLRDGDVLSLGRAKMVFKGGFRSDDLTLLAAPRIDGKPARRPVVFVPGLMGTELWIGSERLWPSPKLMISNPEIFLLPGDPRIEARGILNDVVIVPHIIQSRQYSAMGDYLVEGLGYTRGKDLLEFGYDWRHDVRLAAQRLAEAIEQWQVSVPITIIAHSLGTLVTRYYVERLGGKRAVERIILMGGPHYGTPKGLACILSGPGMLPFGLGDERMRKVLATFPSAYQILPIYPCAVDQNGETIDILKDESWLPEAQRPFLRAARSFRRELGTTSSVPAVSIFGYGLKTKLRINIHRGADGPWQQVDFVEDMAGDQSVPSGSAVLKDSEIHPVLQEHGSLYVDDDVRMRLKVELTRSTTWQGS
jgi:pSer/pThr/pTyr-binding forkhead associated (FHA) protein/pimeloyl-ACP methyl ester carboxylesterase